MRVRKIEERQERRTGRINDAGGDASPALGRRVSDAASGRVRKEKREVRAAGAAQMSDGIAELTLFHRATCIG